MSRFIFFHGFLVVFSHFIFNWLSFEVQISQILHNCPCLQLNKMSVVFFIQKEAKYAAAIYLYNKYLSLWRAVLDMLNNPHCSLSAAFIGTNSLQEVHPVHSTLSIWCFFYTIWVVWIVKCRKICIFFKTQLLIKLWHITLQPMDSVSMLTGFHLRMSN